MMRKTDRIKSLVAIAQRVQTDPKKTSVFEQAYYRNAFFISEFVEPALNAIIPWHTQEALESWLQSVPENTQPKKVGLLLAGNIPFVGWHDLLATFASGNIAVYKPSQTDEVLIEWLIGSLLEVAPEAASYFQRVERLNDIDALIATGSSTTVAHFNYYFRHIPRVVRGSKSSLGVIYGFENQEELGPLVDDIMLYFGLGCRNVTKILVPENYDFDLLFKAIDRYRFLMDHHKYANNCIYHQAIFLMNSDVFLSNDVVMLREMLPIFSPVGVLNYEVYHSLDHAREIIKSHEPDLQCFVSHAGEFEGSIPFGTSQKPSLDNYADGVDTLEFLKGL